MKIQTFGKRFKMFRNVSKALGTFRAEKEKYLRLKNNGGPGNGVQRFLVPIYHWKPVEKKVADPQLL